HVDNHRSEYRSHTAYDRRLRHHFRVLDAGRDSARGRGWRLPYRGADRAVCTAGQSRRIGVAAFRHCPDGRRGLHSQRRHRRRRAHRLRAWRVVPVRSPRYRHSPQSLLAGAGWDGGVQRRILHGRIGVRRAGAPPSRADGCGRNDREHGQSRGLGTGSGAYFALWRNLGSAVKSEPCQGPGGARRGSLWTDTRGRARHLSRGGDMSDMQSLGSLLSGALPLLVIVAIAAYSIRILREYERAVVFLLGRFWKVKGPGLVII